MTAPDVTICIPTWQAEPFITRTLDCARAQTHSNLRILVSVDRCDDGTETLCRQAAAVDSRIEVMAQNERLGWSANANVLLDRVDTEFCFLYFHDDLIEPTYTERLLAALRADPGAASAHCDLERFGDQHGIDPGHAYLGNAPRRLLDVMLSPVKGTPLRSLVRSDVLHQGLRFPQIGADGFWRCTPFQFRMLVAGRALHVPDVLYRRWHRPGSLTKVWDVRERQTLVEGQRASTALCVEEIGHAAPSAEEREWLDYALYLLVMTWTRRNELRLGLPSLIDPAEVWPAFAREAARSAPPAPMDEPLATWARSAAATLRTLEDRIQARAQAPGPA